MNNKEAINELEFMYGSDVLGKEERGYIAGRMAIEALEKQIPMKPNIVIHDGHIYKNCARCSSNISCDDKIRYVSFCGVCSQAIDWN